MKWKHLIGSIIQVFICAILLLLVSIGIVCISFQAWPDELYARLMNRPMDVSIIPEQTVIFYNSDLQ